MAVYKGKSGRVQISGASSHGNLTGSSGGSSARAFMHTIANLSNWSLSQPGPELLDKTVMGDDWKQVTPGIRDGGTISFSGFFDWTDTTGQKKLIDDLNAGNVITYPGTPHTSEGWRFELWPDDDTSVGSTGRKVGCFKFSTEAGTTTLSKDLVLTSVDVGQDKSGIGSISVNMKISDGYFAYSTALQTTTLTT